MENADDRLQKTDGRLQTTEEGMHIFTREELVEIKKWAEVIGYQGTVKSLEAALELNRGIVEKCEAGVERMGEDGGRFARERLETEDE